jgi:hypothetical protein
VSKPTYEELLELWEKLSRTADGKLIVEVDEVWGWVDASTKYPHWEKNYWILLKSHTIEADGNVVLSDYFGGEYDYYNVNIKDCYSTKELAEVAGESLPKSPKQLGLYEE